jgi:hypothetical protein
LKLAVTLRSETAIVALVTAWGASIVGRAVAAGVVRPWLIIVTTMVVVTLVSLGFAPMVVWGTVPAARAFVISAAFAAILNVVCRRLFGTLRTAITPIRVS